MSVGPTIRFPCEPSSTGIPWAWRRTSEKTVSRLISKSQARAAFGTPAAAFSQLRGALAVKGRSAAGPRRPTLLRQRSSLACPVERVTSSARSVPWRALDAVELGIDIPHPAPGRLREP